MGGNAVVVVDGVGVVREVVDPVVDDVGVVSGVVMTGEVPVIVVVVGE